MSLSKTKARKMLKAIYDMASEASMTGSMGDGCIVLITNYNQIREAAIKNGWVDADWVVELKRGESLNEGDEWMDVVGTAAKLFVAQLDDDEEDEEETKLRGGEWKKIDGEE